MVQEGGSDSLRIDIVLQTIAKLEAIEQASARLQELSVITNQARDSLGRFASGLESGMTPALQESAVALQKILTTGFSPKFIGSIQGVNSALIAAGKTFQTYTAEALKSGAISEATAASFTKISQNMIGVGITGKATIRTIQELSSQLIQIETSGEIAAAGTKALSNELDILQIQAVEAGAALERRLNRPLGTAQKAGQGLLLSFSLTQLAAGRLSQAMFGLGFAVLFTGTQFLNLITISVALGAALLSVGLQKLEGLFQESATASELASERIQDYRDALDELKGELRLVADELAEVIRLEGLEALIEAGEIDERTQAFAAFRDAVDKFNATVGDGTEKFKEISDAAVKFGIDVRTTGEASQRYIEIVKGGVITQTEFKELLRISSFDMKEYERNLTEISTAALTLADSFREEAVEALREFDQQVSRRRELEIAIAPFEIDIAAVREDIESQVESARDALSDQLDAIRDTVQEQIEVRREALEEETRLIQDALEQQTDIIRDELEKQTRAIEDQRDAEIEIIREGLADQLEVIRRQLNTRIDEIRDAAKTEIGINKDRVKELKDQDRELQRVLSDLRDRRLDIIFEKIAAQAQLAELERQAQIVGVNTTEEQAILEARIAGLDAQQEATEAEIEERERATNSIADQIDVIEELINEIERARDSAIDAAREESRARQREARKAADIQIREIRRVSKEAARAARDRADAEIDAAQDATQVLIRNAQKRADEDIKNAQRGQKGRERAARDAANAIIDELNRERNVRINEIKLAQQQKRADILRANAIRDEVLPALTEEFILRTRNWLIQIAMLEGAAQLQAKRELVSFILDTAFLFNQLGLRQEAAQLIQSIMTGLQSFQGGGIVPGPIGQPRVIVAHGQEEITPPGKSSARLSAGRAGPLFTIHIDRVDVARQGDLRKVSSAATRGINKALGREVITTNKSKRFNTR